MADQKSLLHTVNEILSGHLTAFDDMYIAGTLAALVLVRHMISSGIGLNYFHNILAFYPSGKKDYNRGLVDSFESLYKCWKEAYGVGGNRLATNKVLEIIDQVEKRIETGSLDISQGTKKGTR